MLVVERLQGVENVPAGTFSHGSFRSSRGRVHWRRRGIVSGRRVSAERFRQLRWRSAKGPIWGRIGVVQERDLTPESAAAAPTATEPIRGQHAGAALALHMRPEMMLN